MVTMHEIDRAELEAIEGGVIPFVVVGALWSFSFGVGLGAGLALR